MTDRKREILQEAVNIIVTRGHAGLTMRAVARASGLKLGALQYHYPTRIDLVRALAEWIAGPPA
jgi:AcrR family transcriptional regulator